MKYIYPFIFIILFCINFCNPATSQEINPCGTDNVMNEIYAKHPELRSDHDEFLLNHLNLRQREDTSVYIIPVVFHILHSYGVENISDEQVHDQMEILNRDFRKMNADTASVITPFRPLIADCRIEFRLATIDDEGNCTNGIEHIYSHEAWIGDAYSKITQWPPEKYLNIWVVGQIYSGAVGYAYYPFTVNNQYQYLDGVVIQNNYLGSIGTSISYHSRVLTHEVGHYLGLKHVWGDHSVATQCGDDGIIDTPITMGWQTCYTSPQPLCNPPVMENYQNYMDYSNCTRMFTVDQASFMRSILQSSIANRNNLNNSSNHTATGIDLTTPPLCFPMADFDPGLKTICPGDSITFYDQSWRAPVDSYSWSFPTGTPSVSSLANPTVTFNSPGYHDVTLTVSNSSGSNTKTVSQAVWVSYPWVDNIGPHNEGFETETADDWLIENPENNNEKWQLVNSVGYNSNHCYKLNNHYDGGNAFDPFYQNRIGGNCDRLISPAFDLSNTTSVVVSFNFSSATFAPSEEDITDNLMVFISNDCGKSWNYAKNLTGIELMTGYYAINDFTPTNSSQWGYTSFNLSPGQLDPNVRFMFQYCSSDYSNNFYLDNFNVSGVLGNEEIATSDFSMNLFPNPITEMQDLYIQCNKNSEVTIAITDINGKYIMAEKFSNLNSDAIMIKGDKMNLQPGIYMVSITYGTGSITKKLVVL